MKAKMNHDQAFAELDAIAFDLLDGPERDAVLEHVDGCDECRAELDARRAVVADLAFAAPLASDSTSGSRSRVRDRLIARAMAASLTPPQHAPPILIPKSTAPVSVPAVPVVVTRWGRVEWIALAAGILFVATLGLFASTARERNSLRDALKAQTQAAIAAQNRRDSLATLVASRDSIIGGLTGRDVSMMTLTSSAAKDPYARMFWDRARNSWTLIAHNMPALKPGRTYQLWLVTKKSKINAGTFDPHNGEAVVHARFALSDPLAAIAITEEPAGGVPQPTGSIIIAANTR